MPRAVPDFAGEPIRRDKFARNDIEIPRYAQIEDAFAADARGLVSDYVHGRIQKPELIKSFRERLQQAETDAFVAGRRAGGTGSMEISDAEAQMLNGRNSRNMKYFRRMVDDIDNGRGRMDYLDRTTLYAQSLWSVYTRGETVDWDDPEGKNARYHWHLDPDAEHCKDCRERAFKSQQQDGFTFEEMVEMGWPGDGATRCRTKCRCNVEVRMKRAVLPERYEPATAAPNAQKGVEELERLLGGPQMPLHVPAAGVSRARIAPDIVEAVVKGPEAEDIGPLLPLVPALLVKPENVYTDGDFRVYRGQGLEALLRRQRDGSWWLVGLGLFDDQRRAA